MLNCIKYQVYSFNENKSRYILSLTLMEKINQLDKLIPYKKYFVFKDDGRVGIFINDFTIDSLLKQKISFNKLSIDYLLDFYIELLSYFLL